MGFGDKVRVLANDHLGFIIKVESTGIPFTVRDLNFDTVIHCTAGELALA